MAKSAGQHPVYRFGDLELDPVRGELRRAGRAVPIDPKPLALLVYLARRRDRVVPREELLETVWRGLAVSDAALTSALRDARRALGDGGATQGVLRTVRGEGLRFVAEVEEIVPTPARDALIGRRELLRRLEGAFAASREGAGRLLWLSGEAGIGKTRLLVELARRAEVTGVDVHFGRCLEEAAGSAYRPWQQIVQGLVGELAPDQVTARYGAVAAEALRLLPGREQHGASAGATGSGEGERLRLFDAAVGLVRAIARERPLLLALDDCQRADDASARLLVHLLQELPRIPLTLVAAYRPEDVGPAHPLSRALAETEPGVEHISLAGLAETEVGDLAATILGVRPPPEATHALWERTAGNPLFVGEIARSLAGAPAKAAVDLVTRVLPTGVHQAIDARLGALSEAARSLLETAAVLGREFDLDVLRALREPADPERDGVELDRACELGLLEPVQAPPGRLRFAHILVRDALYERIAPLRRADLHGASGRALERLRTAQADRHAAELAHHFAEAPGREAAERCIQHARAAGEQALAQAAYQEAARHFELALRALEPFGSPVPAAADRERATLLVLLGRARWRNGANDAAREAFQEAAAQSEANRDAETLSHAALGYAGRTDAEPDVNRVAVELLERALAALPEADSTLRCEVLARLGTELYYADTPERCDALTQTAVEMGERIGDRDALVYALSARTHALSRPDVGPRRRIAICERQLSLARPASEERAISLQETIVCLLEMGDALRLEEAFAEYEREAEALRQPFFRWIAKSFRGTHAFLTGRVEEALRLAQETLELGQSFGTPNAFAIFAVQLLYGRREQGRMGELEPALRNVTSSQPAFRPFRAALPAMYVQMGRARDARDVFHQVMARQLDDVARDQHWIPILAILTAACAALREEEEGRRLHALLLPYAGRLVVPGYGSACDGAVDHHLARLATTFGDLDGADEHFAEAVTLERRAGARLFCAHSQRRWAELLWKRGAPHERDQARELAAEAGATYSALGFERLADQAESVVRG